MKQIIKTNKSPLAIGPYSQAILSDRTLYVPGSGFDPDRRNY